MEPQRMILILVPVIVASCSQQSLDAFYGTNSGPDYSYAQPNQSPAPDPWYAQQNAKRDEAQKAYDAQLQRNRALNYGGTGSY